MGELFFRGLRCEVEQRKYIKIGRAVRCHTALRVQTKSTCELASFCCMVNVVFISSRCPAEIQAVFDIGSLAVCIFEISLGKLDDSILDLFLATQH